MSPKTIVFGILALIGISALGIGGYFAFIEIDEVHQQNVQDLAGFGSNVVPRSMRDDSDGVTRGLSDGNIQLPPSIKEKKLSPTEKVILSLSRDKDELQIDYIEMKQQLEHQAERLQELRAYKAENERFAPQQLIQERLSAEQRLKKLFDNIAEISEFNLFQRHAMELASANLYTDIVRQHQLILNDEARDELIKIIPQFGLCFGEGLRFVSNNREEEQLVIKALSSNDLTLITGGLEADFNRTHTPCLKRLNREINTLLSPLSIQSLNSTTALNNTQSTATVNNNRSPNGPAIDPTLSPTEQLIQRLSYDKEMMLSKASLMEQQLKTQSQELAKLKQYHDSSERFAPLPTLEERNRAQRLLYDYFEDTRDANRFTSFQKEAMSYAAANHYAHFSKRHRLVLTEAIKDSIINEVLPSYSFCFGDGLKFTVDNQLQERQLLNALREQDTEYMDPSLAQQIATISEPCKEQLEQQLKIFY